MLNLVFLVLIEYNRDKDKINEMVAGKLQAVFLRKILNAAQLFSQ